MDSDIVFPHNAVSPHLPHFSQTVFSLRPQPENYESLQNHPSSLSASDCNSQVLHTMLWSSVTISLRLKMEPPPGVMPSKSPDTRSGRHNSRVHPHKSEIQIHFVKSPESSRNSCSPDLLHHCLTQTDIPRCFSP